MERLKNNDTGKLGIPETLVSWKKEKETLVFNFVAKGSSLKSYSTKNNDTLWFVNVVEIFLDLGDDFYYEFEIAPNGTSFIAKIKNQVITFFEQNFFSYKVDLIENEHTYKVEMRMDLSKLSYKPKHIKFNAFRHERVGQEDVQEALNPTFTTFHVKEKFIDFK